MLLRGDQVYVYGLLLFYLGAAPVSLESATTRNPQGSTRMRPTSWSTDRCLRSPLKIASVAHRPLSALLVQRVTLRGQAEEQLASSLLPGLTSNAKTEWRTERNRLAVL